MDSTVSWLFIAALTLASSIDNLGVGLCYGIRGIRISFLSNLWITAICFLLSMGGIYFGIWLASILPETLPVVAGSVFLIIIGLRIMLLAAPRREKTCVSLQRAASESSLKKVMNDPVSADFDNSKDINIFEASVLGVVLAADALINAVGAGMLGFSPLLIALLAASGSFFAVWAGCRFGLKLIHIRIGKYTLGEFGTLISGALLIVIAASVFLR